MRIAVSGHRELDATTTRLVNAAIRSHLTGIDDLVGISCIADGADQVFAQAVLDAGGKLVVVIPAREYRDRLPEASHGLYDELIARAVEVHRLDYAESNSEAHMAASRRMLEDADALLAVWDGQPARGWGGTADVVNLARQMGLDVTMVWPAGASR